MKLIIGLGNPGKEYQKTRHNAGFMLLDKLRESLDFENFHEEKKFNAAVSIGYFEEQRLILAKPLTFMNLSGEAVQKIINFYKIAKNDCFVVYDDLDMPLGTIRMRKSGGSGTHNGMKSVVKALGENFPRLRMGIGTGLLDVSSGQQDSTAFVLKPFAGKDLKIFQEALQKALKALKIILVEGIDKAMNLYNDVVVVDL